MRSVALLAALLLFALSASPDPPREDPRVAELLQSIEGKEKLPASEVFKNIKVLKDVPAGRLVRMMDAGYNRALGVNCDHCHVEDLWESDDKRPKRAARGMITLVNEINAKLETMDEIDNVEPIVNCTTCHRGFVKPAIQMK